MKTRVVVTGMDAITLIRNDVGGFRQGLRGKTVGIGPITYFDVTRYKCKLAAEIKGFDPRQYMDAKATRRMEASSRFAVTVSKETLEQSGIGMEREDPYRVDIYVRSGIGSPQAMEKDVKRLNDEGPSRVNLLLVLPTIGSIAAGNAAVRSRFKGKCLNVVAACATGTHSIGETFRFTQYGEADMTVVGGAEASITPIGIARSTSLTVPNTAEDVSRASIPFDEDKNGFVMSEETGMVALESLEHVKTRGANIPAEVVGYGATCDAFRITSPAEDGSSAARAIENVTRDVGTTTEDTNYVNTHGTSTHHNDLFETKVTKLALGDHAQKVKINSTKSTIGRLLGATGGVEFITCVKSIQDGFIHATAELKRPGEGCDLDYTMGDGMSMNVDVAISNSLGFGGCNASLIVEKLSE